jgi:hypothetical protein
VSTGLKRLVLWDYPRGVWQYDVVVAIIVAFIFLPPKSWFRDQPRLSHASQIASLPSHGESVFWIESELVNPIPESQRIDALGKILSQRTGKPQILIRVEPIRDAEQEIKGYMAFARP